MGEKEINLITTVIILIIIIIITMSILIIIILLFYRKEKEKHKYEIDYLNVQNQKYLLGTRLEIQEQTFNQISREIHDHIGQRLTLARLYVNELAPKIDGPELDILHESSSMIEEAIRDLKSLSRSLTANIIQTEGLIPALQLEINRIKKITQTAIELQIVHDEKIPFMHEEKELIIYRIIQEALQNIIRHADASNVLICFIFKNNLLELTIQDNGKGFNQDDFKRNRSTQSSGLINLKKRAEMLNGQFNITSSLGKGTTLSFQFSYSTNQNSHADNQTNPA
jgi:two-component system NarL family sensor kinase